MRKYFIMRQHFIMWKLLILGLIGCTPLTLQQTLVDTNEESLVRIESGFMDTLTNYGRVFSFPTNRRIAKLRIEGTGKLRQITVRTKTSKKPWYLIMAEAKKSMGPYNYTRFEVVVPKIVDWENVRIDKKSPALPLDIWINRSTDAIAVKATVMKDTRIDAIYLYARKDSARKNSHF